MTKLPPQKENQVINREAEKFPSPARGLYFPEELLNHWSAFGDICQLSGTWMAPNSIFIEKNHQIF